MSVNKLDAAHALFDDVQQTLHDLVQPVAESFGITEEAVAALVRDLLDAET